jgi:hypothetical protein
MATRESLNLLMAFQTSDEDCAAKSGGHSHNQHRATSYYLSILTEPSRVLCPAGAVYSDCQMMLPASPLPGPT